jgi:hypothetical protein
MPLQHRETGDRKRRGRRAVRVADALAGGIEHQAVIGARDGVAFPLAFAERRKAVGAAIVEHGHFAGVGAEGDHGNIQHRAGQHGTVGNFIGPGELIPAVLNKASHHVISTAALGAV